MSRAGDEEEEDECFYKSHDRLVSSSCSCSTSNSDDDNDSNSNSPSYDSNQPFPVPKFPVAMSKFDIWISEPSSVLARRTHLLHAMGLNGYPSLSLGKPASVADLREMGNGEFEPSTSSDHLSRDSSVSAQSHDRCNKSSFCSSSSILSIHSIALETGSLVNEWYLLERRIAYIMRRRGCRGGRGLSYSSGYFGKEVQQRREARQRQWCSWIGGW
ncbi:hypothetical protein QN277_001246 [Acacia crassicarpa]|uniref:Uncharacterized protein n=1 Tax=Acacia crassicarpa TaxID=499986 RepID=A0AAE1N6P8_9FABA|nr:hypothetical protein QN277_001246 [Acacia crassicarpa]